jgi:nucleotide-binding universal stress UspA family protein
MDRHVLVPVDNSEASWQALDEALAQCDGGRITVLHVIDPHEGDYYQEAQDADPQKRSETIEQTARERFESKAVAEATAFETVVETGKPAQAILRHAEDADIDQIVIGSRGLSGLSRVLLGSVAESVVRRAPVPVTVVRE